VIKNFNIILFVTFLLVTQKSYGQEGLGYENHFLSIKTGINYTIDLSNHGMEKTKYFNYDFAVEKYLGNRFSIGVGYNFAKRHISHNLLSWAPGGLKAIRKYSFEDHNLFLEGRYYIVHTSRDVFVLLGTYYSYTFGEHYMEDEPEFVFVETDIKSLSIYGGIGYKMYINSAFAIEGSVTIAPSTNFLGGNDYGGVGGNLKTGVKVIYSFGKR
jgi:hypothetical protein